MGYEPTEEVLDAARADPALAEAMSVTWPEAVREVAFGPSIGFTSWEDGLGLLASAVMPAPRFLMPVALIDEQSLACAVLGDLDGSGAGGSVVRWHLGAVPVAEQGRLLDVDPFLYLESLAAAGLLEQVVVIDRGRIVLKAAADDLRGSATSVSGAAIAVAEFTAGRTVWNRRRIASRESAVMVGALDDIDRARARALHLSLEPLTLQQVVAHAADRPETATQERRSA
jgi:hypothetical protein